MPEAALERPQAAEQPERQAVLAVLAVLAGPVQEAERPEAAAEPLERQAVLAVQEAPLPQPPPPREWCSSRGAARSR